MFKIPGKFIIASKASDLKVKTTFTDGLSCSGYNLYVVFSPNYNC